MKKLIREAQKGDKNAFVKLMETHHNMMYNTARHILKGEDDAVDAVQDTILSCWENIQGLKNSSYFKTWMTRILINNCYDTLRRYNHFTDSDYIPEISQDGKEKYIEDNIAVKSVFCQMPESSRLILNLFYFEDFSVRQIADVLGISQGAVKTRLNRSRNQFKNIYIKKGYHYDQKNG